jgi:hypothetical protein
MATLPGLPMFGHGQIEGFTEKYGMEYQRPRYDETPDHWLVERHEREIAPLLQRRSLFAESSSFLLYDFYQDSGLVDENVFAYSNRNGGDRALVVYNNRYATAHGTIDFSAAYFDKDAGQLRQQRLWEGLSLTGNRDAILACRDSLSGLEYLRRAGDLSQRGLTLDLHAYQCHVFLDWRELHATAEQPWDRLCDQLNGSGVRNLDDALVSLELRPVRDALRQQIDPAIVRLLADLAEHPRTVAGGLDKKIEQERNEFFELAWKRCEAFLGAAQRAYTSRLAVEKRPAEVAQWIGPALIAPVFRERLRAAMRIPALEALFPAPWTVAARRVLPSPSPQFTATAMWGPLLGWCVLELLAESIDAENPERVALDLFDRLRLREPLAQAFAALGFEGEEGWRVAARIKVVLLSGAGVGKEEGRRAGAEPGFSVETPAATARAAVDVTEGAAGEAEQAIPAARPGEEARGEPAAGEDERVALSPALWLDPDVQWLTGVHETQGHAYLVREPYEELLWWLLMPSLLRLAGEVTLNRAAAEAMSRTVEEALATAEAAGYRIDALLGATESPDAGPSDESEDESQAAGMEPPEAGFSQQCEQESQSLVGDPEEAETLARIDEVADTRGWE